MPKNLRTVGIVRVLANWILGNATCLISTIRSFDIREKQLFQKQRLVISHNGMLMVQTHSLYWIALSNDAYSQHVLLWKHTS